MEVSSFRCYSKHSIFIAAILTEIRLVLHHFLVDKRSNNGSNESLTHDYNHDNNFQNFHTRTLIFISTNNLA